VLLHVPHRVHPPTAGLFARLLRIICAAILNTRSRKAIEPMME
jgi:hypothetical protein